MSDYKEILYEKQRNGALITLNRPEAMNAISRSMIKELHEALDDVEQDKDVRAVVLTGAGRAFSSGMDQGNRVGRRRDIQWPYGIVTGQTAAEVIDSCRVVPPDQLIDECFKIVERIAHVPPETVKINLQIATMGLDMMGLRDALTFDKQMSAPAHVMLREELRKPLDDARANKGIREYLQMRDGPFQPEPFGPRARKKNG